MSNVEKRLKEINSKYERLFKSVQPAVKIAESINKYTASITKVNKIVDSIPTYNDASRVETFNSHLGCIDDIPDYVREGILEKIQNRAMKYDDFIDATNFPKIVYERICAGLPELPNAVLKDYDSPIKMTEPLDGVHFNNDKFYLGENVNSLINTKELKTLQLEGRVREIDELFTVYDNRKHPCDLADEIIDTDCLCEGDIELRSGPNHAELLRDLIYESIMSRLVEVKELSGIVKSLDKQIRFILNKIKKKLRNLRQVFKKLHCFHFKNLDDYHSRALTFQL